MRVLEELRYIADSPPQEHGGFHQQTVNTAKDALALFDSLREQRRIDGEVIAGLRRERDALHEQQATDGESNVALVESRDALRAALAEAREWIDAETPMAARIDAMLKS